jgi:hypothetical protein
VTGYDRPGINPKTGRPWVDATGAFLPEAAAFRKLHSDTVREDGHDLPTAGWLEFVAPLTPARRRGLTESAIRAAVGLDVLATKVAVDFQALTSEGGDSCIKRNLDAGEFRDGKWLDAKFHDVKCPEKDKSLCPAVTQARLVRFIPNWTDSGAPQPFGTQALAGHRRRRRK